MKRRIEQKFGYPTNYEALLALMPGINLIEASLLKEVRTKSDRLSSHFEQGRVVDHGFYVNWLDEQVKTGQVTAKDVNALSAEEAIMLAKRVNAEQLKALIEHAERGGIKQVLSTALAAKKE